MVGYHMSSQGLRIPCLSSRMSSIDLRPSIPLQISLSVRVLATIDRYLTTSCDTEPYSKDANALQVVGELGKFNNVIEKVVSWPDKDFNGLTFCAVHDLDNLKSLRTHFAPAHLLNQGMFMTLPNWPSAWSCR